MVSLRQPFAALNIKLCICSSKNNLEYLLYFSQDVYMNMREVVAPRSWATNSPNQKQSPSLTITTRCPGPPS